jgi:hypothetical protein
MLMQIISTLISALFGGVVVALVNHYLIRERTRAEIEKTRAEIDYLRAQTRSLEAKQTEQGQEIRKLLIANLINRFELMHLEALEKDNHHEFHEVPWTFEQELVHLRSLGFIEHYKDMGIVAMKRDINERGKGDLTKHFRITDSGKSYLKLRREVLGEARAGIPE